MQEKAEVLDEQRVRIEDVRLRFRIVWWHHLLYSPLILSLGAGASAWYYDQLFLSVRTPERAVQAFLLYGLVFIGTWHVYCAQRLLYRTHADLTHREAYAILNKRWMLNQCLVTAVFAGYLIFQGNFGWTFYAYFGICAVLTIAYAGAGRMGLRQVLGLKNALVALIWTALIFSAPVLTVNPNSIPPEIGWGAGACFFFILALALVTDARDRFSDTAKATKTLANSLSPNAYTILGGVISLCALGFSSFLESWTYSASLLVCLLAAGHIMERLYSRPPNPIAPELRVSVDVDALVFAHVLFALALMAGSQQFTASL
jgi:4-hydroxybenzoate polyprenyltransferase